MNYAKHSLKIFEDLGVKMKNWTLNVFFSFFYTLIQKCSLFSYKNQFNSYFSKITLRFFFLTSSGEKIIFKKGKMIFQANNNNNF